MLSDCFRFGWKGEDPFPFPFGLCLCLGNEREAWGDPAWSSREKQDHPKFSASLIAVDSRDERKERRERRSGREGKDTPGPVW